MGSGSASRLRRDPGALLVIGGPGVPLNRYLITRVPGDVVQAVIVSVLPVVRREGCAVGAHYIGCGGAGGIEEGQGVGGGGKAIADGMIRRCQYHSARWNVIAGSGGIIQLEDQGETLGRDGVRARYSF